MHIVLASDRARGPGPFAATSARCATLFEKWLVVSESGSTNLPTRARICTCSCAPSVARHSKAFCDHLPDSSRGGSREGRLGRARQARTRKGPGVLFSPGQGLE